MERLNHVLGRPSRSQWSSSPSEAVLLFAAMPHGVDISVTATPTAVELASVRDGLVAFSRNVADYDEAQPLGVFARLDEAIVGGITGTTQCEWLFIEYLWVCDEFRGDGLGARLLREVEAAGRARGCRGVFLDTFSFQAPQFYRRFGFEQFGILQDHPPGHARHFFFKPL